VGSSQQQESQSNNHNNLENMEHFFYDAGTLEISPVEDRESQDAADHREDHVDYYEDQSDFDD
jgi:hypothetical protein